MMMVKAQSCGQYLSWNSFVHQLYSTFWFWNNDCQFDHHPIINWSSNIGCTYFTITTQDLLKIGFGTFFKSNFRLECWLLGDCIAYQCTQNLHFALQLLQSTWNGKNVICLLLDTLASLLLLNGRLENWIEYYQENVILYGIDPQLFVLHEIREVCLLWICPWFGG